MKRLRRKKMEGMKGALLAMGMMIGVMVFVGGAMGAQHVVGGSQGWDESTDLNSWASSETFKVGDQLGKSVVPHHFPFSSFNPNWEWCRKVRSVLHERIGFYYNGRNSPSNLDSFTLVPVLLFDLFWFLNVEELSIQVTTTLTHQNFPAFSSFSGL